MNDTNNLDYISGAIAQAQAKIEELQAAIRTLESLRALVGGGVAPTSSGKMTFEHDSFFNMTGAAAAEKYLRGIKKTASAKALADALIAGGWKTASKNVPENIRAILNRNPTFVVINGEFGLAEWYPGRKAASRQRTVVAPEELSDDALAEIVEAAVLEE